MAQNITLMGASYPDVPAVELPKTGGGTATFTDTSDADAVAADIAQGKTAYVDGQKVTGTASGGGGEDLIKKKILGELTDYVCDLEEGTYTGSAFSNFTTLVNVRISNISGGDKTYFFDGCTHLETVDLSFVNSRLGGAAYRNCKALKTVIYRNPKGLWAFNAPSTSFNVLVLDKETIVPALASSIFNDCPAFKSGGTGATIYIPKVLYDHLGDGSSSDYKAATNWSVIDGFGTITWAQIEGSWYETHYADGTVIST